MVQFGAFQGPTGASLLYILCAIVGSGSSISCSASFTLANRLRNPTFAATVSTGGGATGVVSFSVWMLLTQGIFTYDERGIRYALSILFGLGVLMPIVAYSLYSTFIRLQWVKSYLANEPDNTVCRCPEYLGVAQAQSPPSNIADRSNYDSPNNEGSVVAIPTNVESKDNVYANQYATSSKVQLKSFVKKSKTSLKYRGTEWCRILQRCYPAVLFNFTACYSTFLLFPSVGPLRWSISSTRKDIVTVSSLF